MKTFAARHAKNRFGELLDTTRAEPVVIEKHGRAVAVVLSVEEYDRLEALENTYWAARAAAAEAGGYLGAKESGRRLKGLMRGKR
jgi:prevent-host-death family protein